MGTETQTIIKFFQADGKTPMCGYKCKIVISKNGTTIGKPQTATTSNAGIINVTSGFGLTIAVIIMKDGKAKQLATFVSSSTVKSTYHEIKAPKVPLKIKNMTYEEAHKKALEFQKKGFDMVVVKNPQGEGYIVVDINSASKIGAGQGGYNHLTPEELERNAFILKAVMASASFATLYAYYGRDKAIEIVVFLITNQDINMDDRKAKIDSRYRPIAPSAIKINIAIKGIDNIIKQLINKKPKP